VAILEAVLTCSYYDQLIVNRFHYLATGDATPVTPAFALLSAMGGIAPTASPWTFPTDTILWQYQGNASSGVVFKSLYVRNLYDVTDFVEQAYPATVLGKNTGEGMSPAVAIGLTATRVRTDIKRASKRFAGVSEDHVEAGGVLNSTGLSVAAGLASKCSATLSYTVGGASVSMVPAVLGLEEYTAPSGNRAYRVYATESAQLDHIATGFTYSGMPQVRTQTSRQYGRGA